jgi:hypothetical protein
MTAQRATRSFPVTNSALSVARGRASHNARRRALADERRARLVSLLAEADFHRRGWKADLARQLGVHRATVGRDLRQIIRDARDRRCAMSDSIGIMRCQIADMLHASLADPEDDQ